MKRYTLISIIMMIISLACYSQEKGSYLTISGGVGYGGFNYSPKGINSDGKNQYRIGGQIQIGYSYFFTRHWGISTGIGVSYHETLGKFPGELSKENYYSLGTFYDNDPIGTNLNKYELRARLGNWEEKQTGYFLEIPLMLSYQHKFGENQKHGLYFGLGGKLQLPINTRYSVVDGKYENDSRLNVSGKYEGINSPNGGPDIGAPGEEEVPQHGYGSIYNPNASYGWKGKNELKMSFALTGEVGALFGVSRRCDLMLGAFIDYGLNNIKKENKELLKAPIEDYHPQSEDNIGKGIIYNGMLNSSATGKVKLISGGVKIGLRIKLGKLPQEEEVEEEIPVILDRFGRVIDTLIIEHHYYNEPKQDTQILIVEPKKEVDEDGLTPSERDILKEKIFFDLGSASLYPASKFALDRKVALMNKHPELRIRILGNTCDRGNEKINIPLGLKRAEEARKYMISRGIEPNRIVSATQSDHDPLLPNTTEANRALNRRCDFEVDRR